MQRAKRRALKAAANAVDILSPEATCHKPTPFNIWQSFGVDFGLKEFFQTAHISHLFFFYLILVICDFCIAIYGHMLPTICIKTGQLVLISVAGC